MFLTQYKGTIFHKNNQTFGSEIGDKFYSKYSAPRLILSLYWHRIMRAVILSLSSYKRF